jgi:hypothetical protein
MLLGDMCRMDEESHSIGENGFCWRYIYFYYEIQSNASREEKKSAREGISKIRRNLEAPRPSTTRQMTNRLRHPMLLYMMKKVASY